MKKRKKTPMVAGRHNTMAIKLLADKVGPLDEVKGCREQDNGWVILCVIKGKEKLYRVRPIVKTEISEIKKSLFERFLG